MPEPLTLGVIGASRKPGERRLPIHPAHLERIAPGLRARILVEHGYGERFGVGDEALGPLVAGLRSREELIAGCDVILLPKPVAEEVGQLRPGQVLWGWPHLVQDEALTQIAIDRGLTIIAWEAMNAWSGDGAFAGHVFHKNNELAGYCSVLHALQLLGRTGAYGRRLRAAVISFGATGRGAVHALSALGVSDVTVLTQRSVAQVASTIPTMRLAHFDSDPDRPGRARLLGKEGPEPMAAALAQHDVVVNCILQDPSRPLLFVMSDELRHFARGSLIVDVSCDEGMGFEWAHPTSFADPMTTVGSGVHYYAVDHSPSHLWDAATWEISEALLPYLPIVMAGRDAWEADETIRRAVEISAGTVRNPEILAFQDRAEAHPHERL